MTRRQLEGITDPKMGPTKALVAAFLREVATVRETSDGHRIDWPTFATSFHGMVLEMMEARRCLQPPHPPTRVLAAPGFFALSRCARGVHISPWVAYSPVEVCTMTVEREETDPREPASGRAAWPAIEVSIDTYWIR